MEKKVPFQSLLLDKTLPELKELLQLHEKVLSNKKLLGSLPDKGEKITHSVEMLQKLILEKQKSLDSCIVSHVTRNNPHPDQIMLPVDDGNRRDTQPAEVVKHPAALLVGTEHMFESAESESETPTEHCERCYDVVESDVSTALSERLENLQVSQCKDLSGDVSSTGKTEALYTNSYENVIRRHADDCPSRAPFKPNRSLKIADIHSLPEQYRFKFKTTPTLSQLGDLETGSTNAEGNCLSKAKAKELHKEESAACTPDYKFKSAKEISVKDSVKLQKQQRAQFEATQLRHATERLAAQLHIKTVSYSPPEVDMSYRSGGFGEHTDSDSGSDKEHNDPED